jgi:prefoldin beta subunit
MNNEIPKEAQELLIGLQTAQQQFQNIAVQKESFNLQKLEIEKALEELEKSKEQEVFKAVGPILIKTDKPAMTTELTEKLETISLRAKTLAKQETKLHEKLQTDQKKLQEMLSMPAKPDAGIA